jgi:hypothetical protein
MLDKPPLNNAFSGQQVVAAFFGNFQHLIGYVLLMTWFFMISRRLFQLGQNISKQNI